jgi:CRISPR-associated protein Csd1
LARCGFVFVNKKSKSSSEGTDEINDDVTASDTDGPLSIESFVRFAVSIPGQVESELWKNQSVQQSYIHFYQGYLDIPQLCYVSGKIAPRMEKHPKKILPNCTGAKLISLKDENFKYHGRFTDLHQPVSVSYEVSQKAHNALGWLIERQGKVNGEQVILAWETHGKSIPSPLSDFPFEMEDEPTKPETAVEYSEQLGRASAGYYQMAVIGSANNDTTVIIMGLDAATTGRASITYYQEITGNDYLQRLRHWYESCSWNLTRYDKRVKKYIHLISTPSPQEIFLAVYGKLDSKSANVLRKAIFNRLLPCIMESRPLPFDLVQPAFRRVVNPISFKNNGGWDAMGWEAALTTTCALVRKYFEEESSAMALDENRMDRNYLFGRLLALADKAEKDVLREENSTRSTNAMRYMQVFQQRPNDTWMKLFVHLLPPYFAKMGGRAEFYKSKMNQIANQFEPGDFTMRKPLDGRFLEGYHCQMQALYTKRESEGTKEEKRSDEECVSLKTKLILPLSFPFIMPIRMEIPWMVIGLEPITMGMVKYPMFA